MTSKKYVLKTGGISPNLTIDYKKELNPSQLEVVTGADGPCLVLAGAGSGKTRTLIYRVAYLLEHGVRPEEVLLVTFTNKAAQEMRERVETLLQARSKGLWCGTFHHIGNRVLRAHGRHIDLNPDFGILDDEDSRDLVKACAKAVESKPGDARFPKPGVVQAVLSFSVNAKLSIADVVRKRFAYLAPFVRDFERIQAMYADKKRRSANLDYDDLLVRWIELLERSEAVRERLTSQFRYCLVDEYQDTNRLQQTLVGLLAAKHRNLLVVGDDAQSIYSFRAADIKNILSFPETYPDAKVFKLETNYRSTSLILNLANESIKHNVHQFSKKLKSVHGDGARPLFVKVRDTRQEAAFTAQRVLEFKESGVDLAQIAVLFRARYQAAELELELARRGIPYVIRGGIRFFEQAHIKDVLSFLKILVNRQDEIAWVRALTLQPGIGGGYAERIVRLAEKAPSIEAVAEPAFGADLPAKVRTGLDGFKRTLGSLLRDDLRERPDALIEQVLENGYNKHVLMNFENAQERLEDLREFVNFAHTYGDLKSFLADVTLRESFKGETLVDAADGGARDRDQLVLSTIHQAKGLEWKAVFVIGLAEGLFPHARSMEDEDALEEERRLFYVAVTRAREELILVHAMTRFDYNAGTVICRPSAFVLELPSSAYDDVEVEEREEEETIYLD